MSIKILRTPKTWNVHTHSKYSVQDALPEVGSLVAQAAAFGQQALGLTDHGNMAGTVELYQECKKHGLKPFPGTEFYIVHDRADKKAKRYHLGILAHTTQGYSNLVRLNTLSHQNHFHKPLIDLNDLATLSEQGLLKGLVALTGCHFSFVVQSLITDGPSEAAKFIKAYEKWFDAVYVEGQNHNIAHDENGEWNDERVAQELFVLSQELSVPYIITQDAHYTLPREQADHDMLKRLIAYGDDPDDAVFPGDGFFLASDLWFSTHHSPERFDAGVAGLQHLLDSHDLAIPALDTYHYNIPFTVASPDDTLRERTIGKLAELVFTKVIHTQTMLHDMEDRLAEELAIITDVGMAGYLILVAEVTDWMRENGILYQARGSASGSVACYLLGITQANPIQWKLPFGRFISRDRTKPPDIDLDIEHERRQEVIDMLEQRFSVHHIGTWGKYGLTADEDDESGDEDASKGSLLREYFTMKNKQGIKLSEWSDIPKDEQQMLKQLAEIRPYKSRGIHPAGLVLTTNPLDFDDVVPLMWIASSKTMVSQYAMNQVEALGFVKLDALGLKMLTIFHTAFDNLGRDVFAGQEWIPWNDKDTYKAIGKGMTQGAFQLEGYAAMKGCQDLKPTTINDVIAAMALFRPSPMNTGTTQSYIDRKHRREVVPEQHPIVAAVTADTHGLLIYQEQVMDVLRALGMDPDNLTKFLKAVKASNENIGNAAEVIKNYHDHITLLALEAGFDPREWEKLWHAINGFAAYSFNKAHSTAYGHMAYRGAYMATHHPIEYYSAVLSVHVGSKEKEPRYVSAVRRLGIKILKPDVNYSGVSYAPDPNGRGIRRGLLAIKGIGGVAAEEIVAARPPEGFGTIEQFTTLVNHRKVTGLLSLRSSGDLSVGVVGKLYEAGALESLLGEEAA